MNMPILRLQLDGMKVGLLQYLGDHHVEVEAAVVRAIERFDLGAAVEDAVACELPPLLRQAIRQQIAEALYSDQVRDALRATILGAITEALRVPG